MRKVAATLARKPSRVRDTEQPRSPVARAILPDDSDPQRLGRAERPVRSRVPLPMLRERRAVLEDDRQAEPGECCEGRDENEGSQEDHPILNAEVVHGTEA
jgi:hypothetical protein